VTSSTALFLRTASPSTATPISNVRDRKSVV
jgi:hypothetical protein